MDPQIHFYNGEVPESVREELKLYAEAAAKLSQQGRKYGDIMWPGNPLHDAVSKLRTQRRGTLEKSLGSVPCDEIKLGEESR